MTPLPSALQDALKKSKNLPMLPGVMLKVLDLWQDPNASLTDVVQVVGRDPALSARLVRVASSAAYISRNPVTTVDRAVNMLGLNATMCVALSFSIVKSSFKSTGDAFDANAFWRRAVTTAVCARALGQHTGLQFPNELLLAGLLQDLGMLALHTAVGAPYDALWKDCGGRHDAMAAAEREALGADHAAVGAWLLESWRLPPQLVEAVAWSHTPAPSDAPAEMQAFWRACRWAGALAELWAGDAAAGARATQEVEQEGLSRAALESVLAQVATEVPQETAVLELHVPGLETSALLERARDALLELNLSANERARDAEERAHHDTLTGAYNRAYLNLSLPTHFERARAKGAHLSVLFVDVDHFKRVNDAHGHQAGDAVLQGVASVLRDAVRGADVVARYGGEEFVLVLPETGPQEALLVAERIRRNLEKHPHQAGDTTFHVTASVGLASFHKDNFASPGALVGAADQCVYAAKRAGRNCVMTPQVQVPAIETRWA